MINFLDRYNSNDCTVTLINIRGKQPEALCRKTLITQSIMTAIFYVWDPSCCIITGKQTEQVCNH